MDNKKENLEEKIKLLTENLAQEKISNMKKDTLAVNLTKEIANLKLEIMNLKKGGNE
ncbi:D-alanyl-D-alanine carboxypeptidase [Clostridium botulinum]|nr:D-alanyl-D-alanine carboxypeptidase [Clostridium botulinum]